MRGLTTSRAAMLALLSPRPVGATHLCLAARETGGERAPRDLPKFDDRLLPRRPGPPRDGDRTSGLERDGPRPSSPRPARAAARSASGSARRSVHPTRHRSGSHVSAALEQLRRAESGSAEHGRRPPRCRQEVADAEPWRRIHARGTRLWSERVERLGPGVCLRRRVTERCPSDPASPKPMPSPVEGCRASRAGDAPFGVVVPSGVRGVGQVGQPTRPPPCRHRFGGRCPDSAGPAAQRRRCHPRRSESGSAPAGGPPPPGFPIAGSGPATRRSATEPSLRPRPTPIHPSPICDAMARAAAAVAYVGSQGRLRAAAIARWCRSTEPA